MDSYGALLKEAREAKNLDLDTVARETAIIRRYIEGLEEEDNSAFPGEAYLTGFLRNYADYLNVDTELVLTLYKNKQLQESPVPEGLIEKHRPKYLIPLIAAASVVVVAAITIPLVIFFNKKMAENKLVAVEVKNGERKYQLADKTFTDRLYKGDQLIYPGAEGDVILTVSKTVETFGIQTPVGNLYTELSEEAELDIDGDAISDLIVYVSDVSMTDESRGAEVRILKRHGSAVAGVAADDILLASEIGNLKYKVIFEDTRAYPFTLNGNFRASCVFRIKVDRSEADEQYYTSGEVITRTAANGIRLWISNINAVKFTIIADLKSYDLDIGKAGQVVAQDIKWIKDTDGKYKLVVIELD